MKLAEALVLRADYQKRITQLKQRLLLVARVQEGDRPAEIHRGCSPNWSALLTT